MLDHMILTVSDITRSLAFYEAALKPLQIRFFMPYKGEDGHPDLWGFNVGAQPTSFAWTRGRDGWDDRPTHPGHCRILTHGESHPSRWLQMPHVEERRHGSGESIGSLRRSRE